MPPAARVGDVSTHGGSIVGPGAPTVVIAGVPAAVAGDMHVCALPPAGHQPTASPFPLGSTKVMICGRPAVRTTDACVCGATAAVGALAVLIG
jgi:uncharacterized Zn-binding protein involved in type VI secretion